MPLWDPWMQPRLGGPSCPASSSHWVWWDGPPLSPPPFQLLPSSLPGQPLLFLGELMASEEAPQPPADRTEGSPWDSGFLPLQSNPTPDSGLSKTEQAAAGQTQMWERALPSFQLFKPKPTGSPFSVHQDRPLHTPPVPPR